jgi:hypothetical protein
MKDIHLIKSGNGESTSKNQKWRKLKAEITKTNAKSQIWES